MQDNDDFVPRQHAQRKSSIQFFERSYSTHCIVFYLSLPLSSSSGMTAPLADNCWDMSFRHHHKSAWQLRGTCQRVGICTAQYHLPQCIDRNTSDNLRTSRDLNTKEGNVNTQKHALFLFVPLEVRSHSKLSVKMWFVQFFGNWAKFRVLLFRSRTYDLPVTTDPVLGEIGVLLLDLNLGHSDF